jgi:hypothetical protein
VIANRPDVSVKTVLPGSFSRQFLRKLFRGFYQVARRPILSIRARRAAAFGFAEIRAFVTVYSVSRTVV